MYVNLHYINAFSLVKNQSLMKPTLPPTVHKTAVTQPSETETPVHHHKQKLPQETDTQGTSPA